MSNLYILPVLVIVLLLHYKYFKKQFSKKFNSKSDFRRGFFYSLFDSENNQYVYARLRTNEARYLYRKLFIWIGIIILFVLIIATLLVPITFLTGLYPFFLRNIEIVFISICVVITALVIFVAFVIKHIQKIDKKIKSSH